MTKTVGPLTPGLPPADALMRRPRRCDRVDPQFRFDKKRQEALRLRGVDPATTLRMGFSMMAFGRKLNEAGHPGRR